MRILTFPDPILFQECQEVTVFGPELETILNYMWECMKAAKGIGLAANQVSFQYRIFVMEGPNSERIDFVNPKITKKSTIAAMLQEGCLSAPGEHLIVPDRSSWVEVTYQDFAGETKTRVFKDIWAVCVQHEIGHLNGESFMESKSILKSKRKLLAKKWKLKQNK